MQPRALWMFCRASKGNIAQFSGKVLKEVHRKYRHPISIADKSLACFPHKFCKAGFFESSPNDFDVDMSCLFDAQKYRVIMKDAVPLEKMATVFVGEHWPSLHKRKYDQAPTSARPSSSCSRPPSARPNVALA